MGWIESERTKNILLGILNMMLILGVFFLGFNAAGWTSAQVEEYCHEYNEIQCMNMMQQDFDINVTDLPKEWELH